MAATWETARTRPLRLLVALGAVPALAAALAGCAGAGAAAPADGPASLSGTAVRAAAAGTGQPARPLGGEPGTATVEAGGFPDGGPVTALTGVRAAGQDGFDRVVLEFGDRVPGYRVGYVEPPVTEDGSGRPVDVEGAAFLEIRATPASGVDRAGDRARETYPGPDVLDPPGTTVVTEVVRTGDFEAMVAWVVGLDRQVPFSVATLQDPPRLVVDLRTGAGGTGAWPVGEGSTGDAVEEASGGPVTLTDVRLGAHDGFDRIVFEVAGDGQAGWDIGYTDDPRSQGSGAPVEVPGGAALGISLTGIALPGDAPAGVRPWDGGERLAIRDAQVVEALVVDTLLEGRHDFFAGVDQRRPFAVERLSDPQRIVVDVRTAEAAGDAAGDATGDAAAVELGERCTSPAGFSVGHPSGWSVNSGETVPACTRFAPGELDLPEASDVRVAATAFSVRSVTFERATAVRPGEVTREERTVDGRDAVRVALEVQEGLYPLGTPVTTWAVRLADGPDGEPRTLVADAVGLPGSDHGRDVAVLDAQVTSLDLDAG